MQAFLPGLTGHAYVDTGVEYEYRRYRVATSKERPKAGTEAGTNIRRSRGTRIAAAFIIHPARKGPGACVRGSIVGKRPRDRNVGFTLTIRFFASVQEHRPACAHSSPPPPPSSSSAFLLLVAVRQDGSLGIDSRNNQCWGLTSFPCTRSNKAPRRKTVFASFPQLLLSLSLSFFVREFFFPRSNTTVLRVREKGDGWWSFELDLKL